ncbi:hypothetical protein PAMP_007044 [Pampus punctatissimus]
MILCQVSAAASVPLLLLLLHLLFLLLSAAPFSPCTVSTHSEQEREWKDTRVCRFATPAFDRHSSMNQHQRNREDPAGVFEHILYNRSDMSIPTGFQELRVNVDRGEKITNKTQIQFPQPGDNNANQLSSIGDQGGRGLIEDTRYSSNSLPPLVSQSESHGKLVIWDSEQQCMEPEIREFELVECTEIHTFLGNRDQAEENEEEDDGGSLRDGKDEGPMSISSSSTASSASIRTRRNDNDSNKVESRIQRSKEEQKRIGCHSTEELDTCVTDSIERRDTRSGRSRDRERQKGGLKESKSETNVFVSSLSAMSLSGSLSSALDCSGEAQSLISLPNSKTNPYPNANNTTSAQTRRRAAPVDANQNTSPLHPQEKYYHVQYREEEGSHRRNGLSSDRGLGQRRKAGFEEKVLPPRRQQLVRPLCQTEMGRAKSLTEPNVHQAETGLPPYPKPSLDSHGNGSNRKFTRSSLREPSDFSHLYNSAGFSQARQPNQAAQCEDLPVENQPTSTAQCNSSPSNPSTLEKRPQTQLTYRRNCSSPNRTGVDSRASTPPHSPLRTPQGSPRRQPSMYLVSKNVSGVVRHIPPGCNTAIPSSAQGYGNPCLRAPVRTNISTTGIPKAPVSNQQSSPNSNNSSPKENAPSPKLKPKGVRPKIITYVRKNPQFKPQAADRPYQVSSLPSRLSAYTHGQTASSLKDTPKDPFKPDTETRGTPVLSASNLLYDKYRQEMQTNIFPSGLLSRSIRPPGHTNTVPPAHTHAAPHTHTHSHTAPPKLGGKAGDFYGAPSEMGRSASFKGSSAEDALQSRTTAQTGGSGSLLRSGRGLRLGLGAVTRTTTGSAKSRGPGQGQRLTLVFSQPVQPVSPATSQKSEDNTVAASAQPQAVVSQSLLPKTSQSGLRPPGFSSSSRHPAGRLAAFGFVRSSSVSSVSSAHSADSTQSDPCRTAHRLSVSEEPPLHRVTTSPPSTDHRRGAPCRSNSLQPPSTPALPRRYLPAQPRSSPGVQSGQRPAAVVRGTAPQGSPNRTAPLRLQQEQQESLQREKDEAQQKEKERQAEKREKEEQRVEVQRLQGHCERQERQLKALREELRKTSLGLEAFIITTQHYCLKNKTTEENKRKLSLEMQKIREEMAANSMRWERLHHEKTALEVAFEQELQELQLQQEAELSAVEEGLRKCHSAETEHLKAEHRSEMEELRTQQQEQDQVDTLTFQNQSLKDKAKRFEEALRRSTDEQIVDALAPYQHIEQDLKSLKEVVEMKNQQIHQQEKKISDLEKVAQKNVFLEEKIQVLQQQNEDLKARIDMNLVLSRQLSEENANLQESVEKESTEKKRLSRNNEELLWRLQTSPLMSPSSSPLHRSFSTSPAPSSPFFSSSPVAGCDSPTHCYGCPQQAQYSSPSHRAATNQNSSPGPATPTHRAASNQNYSPSLATPTHRASANRCNSPACFNSLQR